MTAPYAYPSSAKPSFPSSSISSGPLGFALNAVDKVAGRKTREQLESGVAGKCLVRVLLIRSFIRVLSVLLTAGTKLFSKLTK